MWIWKLQQGSKFSVAYFRKEIDMLYLDRTFIPTNWLTMILGKENVLLGRIRLNRFSTRSNFIRIGMYFLSLVKQSC